MKASGLVDRARTRFCMSLPPARAVCGTMAGAGGGSASAARRAPDRGR
jgi:hypothetical protein